MVQDLDWWTKRISHSWIYLNKWKSDWRSVKSPPCESKEDVVFKKNTTVFFFLGNIIALDYMDLEGIELYSLPDTQPDTRSDNQGEVSGSCVSHNIFLHMPPQAWS